MKYVKADISLTAEIHSIVQKTIKTVYPKYYPSEVVSFFCSLHAAGNIEKDIKNRQVYVLYHDNVMVGTGSITENHITRVYVLMQYQGRGYGTFIIKQLETEIQKNYDCAFLDASLPAVMLYEKLGYKTVSHQKYDLNNGVVLIYEIMKKEF